MGVEPSARESTEPEIDQFQAFLLNEDVLQLDISMAHASVVHVAQDAQ
jgi:hypothetical protein